MPAILDARDFAVALLRCGVSYGHAIMAFDAIIEESGIDQYEYRQEILAADCQVTMVCQSLMLGAE